jgi:hypothetical protein
VTGKLFKGIGSLPDQGVLRLEDKNERFERYLTGKLVADQL